MLANSNAPRFWTKVVCQIDHRPSDGYMQRCVDRAKVKCSDGRVRPAMLRAGQRGRVRGQLGVAHLLPLLARTTTLVAMKD